MQRSFARHDAAGEAAGALERLADAQLDQTR
jgi:hypothetical protein